MKPRWTEHGGSAHGEQNEGMERRAHHNQASTSTFRIALHCIDNIPPHSRISLFFCCSTLVHARKALAPSGSSSTVDVVPAVSTFTRIATKFEDSEAEIAV